METKKENKSLLQPSLDSPSSIMAPNSLVCSHTQVGHEKDINAVAVHHKDKLVATGSEDKTIKVTRKYVLS